MSASCTAESTATSTPNNCPLTPASLEDTTPFTNQTASHTSRFDCVCDTAAFESPDSPKHRMAGFDYYSHQAGKRAVSTPTLADCSPCSPVTESESVDKASGWDDTALLTSAQCSTIALNNAISHQDGHEHYLVGHKIPALGPFDCGEYPKQSYPGFWRPEVKLDGGSLEYQNFAGTLISEPPFDYSALTGAPTHEDFHHGIATPALTQNGSVTSDSSDRATTPAVTHQTAHLLAMMFPPLPLHIDPPGITSKKIAIAPNDLYSPLFVRNEGTKNREGWCGYCQRWLPLRESSFNYDKKYTHGICPSTGRPFEKPVEMKTSFGRRNGKVNTKVARCEGLCGNCREWIRLGGRSGPANSWWRHAFQVFPNFLNTPSFA